MNKEIFEEIIEKVDLAYLQAEQNYYKKIVEKVKELNENSQIEYSQWGN